ncbi:MAG: allantoicase [Acidiferrobacterales bacterium]|nr:allantoicase [Acidiferrobacterales bacterium]
MSFVICDQGTNLADGRLGATVISVTDEFFAPCARMLNPEPPIFIEGKFDENGKWMDGWESRRKRIAGHDSCVIQLAVAGVISKINIDTSNFIGNFPPNASLEACFSDEKKPSNDIEWTTLLEHVTLSKDAQHLFDVDSKGVFTHVRLRIFPDGGIARLRIYGEPKVERQKDTLIDLASVLEGGKVIACSDECFGSSMTKLNYPGSGINMGDGWETARRREPGNEWAIIQLASPGILEYVEFDTAYYKGNYPDRVSLQGGNNESNFAEEVVNQSLFWKQILSQQKLEADSICRFNLNSEKLAKVSHVKINIIPDGGLSRVRLFGRPTDD